ncbi:hypothetical protein Trydic_g10470 [Trypoxylus dichotomus]
MKEESKYQKRDFEEEQQNIHTRMDRKANTDIREKIVVRSVNAIIREYRQNWRKDVERMGDYRILGKSCSSILFWKSMELEGEKKIDRTSIKEMSRPKLNVVTGL